MAKLVVKSGRNAGAEFKLNGDRMIMGRRSQCPIPVADAKASREHAVIIRKGDIFFLQDLSRNGTLLNGNPAVKTEAGSALKFGDQIKIGDTVMEMVDEKAEPINIEIPGYTIYEKVGSGGMGIVYKAKQLSMDRIVALKVLNERYSSNNEFVDRFIREARAAGKLNHPNVIHVHDISKANGRHYFSMEFIDGASLKEILRVDKKLDFKKALDIILQSAKALEFAHENQIVHRDVKPDNIMLTKEGIVKIADLGIAKTFEEAAPAAKEHRRVMGTPHYMAPEQALGKTIDHRVDIYSLGATFYHIITGSTPFSGSTAHEILKAHIQESLQPIQELNSTVPDPVCFIIERMMAKLPEKRYASMSKLIEDIERVQSNTGAGIDRIEAGDSTIMRAVKGTPKKEGRAEKSETRGPTDEVVTGVQTPVAKAGLALILIAVFAATVAAVVVVTSKFSNNNEVVTPPNNGQNPPPPQPTPGPPTENRNSIEAKNLLKQAKEASTANDGAGYERLLRELVSKYSATPEAEEGKKLLDAHVAKVKEDARVAAEARLTEAKKFEEANADKFEENLDKFQKVMAGAQDFPAVLDAAKSKVEEFKRKINERDTKKIDDALKVATTDANDFKSRHDYDAARKALQGFIDQYKSAPQKKTADEALARVNADAQARLKLTRDAASTMDIGPAIAEWDKYAAQVKDSTAAADVSAAKESLEARAQKITDDKLTEAAEFAKKYDYGEALLRVRAAKKVVGGTKCAPIAEAREDSLVRQKALYERVITAANEAIRAEGKVALNFQIEDKLGKDWKLSRIQSDSLSLDSASGAGTSRKVASLTPKEQYQFHLQFLPKKDKLTSDDHKALAAFCLERGLTDEASEHDKQK